MFALRGQAGIALGSLLSAKLNQWTLLVGMIPGVYGLSSGSFATPIPMGSFQLNEILLTAAQSLLAVVLLLSLRLDIKGALLLFGLFIGQFIPFSFLASLSGIKSWPAEPAGMHLSFVMLYLLVSCYLLVCRRKVVVTEWSGNICRGELDKIMERAGGVQPQPNRGNYREADSYYAPQQHHQDLPQFPRKAKA
jgi:cation:H+ antiporter